MVISASQLLSAVLQLLISWVVSPAIARLACHLTLKPHMAWLRPH
jgi:hypothetical protein